MSVTATVRRAPVPQIVPAALKPFLQPVTDPGGQLLDWTLDPLVLFGSTDPEHRSAAGRFRAWRGSYLSSWDLGDRPLVESLQRWADQHLPGQLSVLPALAVTADRVDPHRAARLARDIELVRARAAAAAQQGFGLLDVDRQGLVRTAAALGDGDDVIVADPAVTVAFRGGVGLLLRLEGEERELVVDEYELAPDGIVVRPAGGGRRLLPGVGPAARALQWLAPGSAHVRVKAVPLTSVWARPLVGLGEGSALAVRVGAELRVEDGSAG